MRNQTMKNRAIGDQLLAGLNEPINRRQLLQRAGKLLLGASIVGLTACLPRTAKRYEVKIQVSQSRGHFDPGGLVIPTGSTVVWQNQAIYPQTVTCDPGKAKGNPNIKLPSGASPWDSGTLYPGQTWQYTFNTPGEYLYFSRFAASEGSYLIGTVKVT